MQDNNISEIIRSSLENVKSIVDSETIIGEPISTPSGTTIIPISRISVGIASGGLDFGGRKKTDSDTAPAKNFGGGGGTGVTIRPEGFLVIHADGSVEMLNMGASGSSSSDELSNAIAGIVKQTPSFICKMKNAFSDKKKAKSQNNNAEAENSDNSEDNG